MLKALRRRLTTTSARKSIATRRREASRQRGAVLVEAAIALPTVTLLMFGILEYGLLFGDGMDLASSIRAGSRTAASMPVNSTSTDYAILQQIKTTSGRLNPQIEQIVVYRASDEAGAPDPICTSGHALLGTCNVYTQSDLSMSEGELASSGHSDAWAPATRVPGTDYIGVYAKVHHVWITGLLGSGRNVTDTSVMRVQPLPSDGSTDTSGFWPDPVATTLANTTSTAAVTTTTKAVGGTTTTSIKSGTTTTSIKKSTTTTTAQATTTSTTVQNGPTTTTVPKTTTTKKPTTTTVRPTTTTTTSPPQPPPQT